MSRRAERAGQTRVGGGGGCGLVFRSSHDPSRKLRNIRFKQLLVEFEAPLVGQRFSGLLGWDPRPDTSRVLMKHARVRRDGGRA